VHLDDTAAQKTFVLKCFFLDTFIQREWAAQPRLIRSY